MKIALCFLISYDHTIHKEHIWIKWINEIKQYVNVYIHYTNAQKIKSAWIKKHILPPNYIQQTDYLHVVPAYMALMHYALNADKTNQWFCFITDACCPIIPALEFKKRFFKYYNKSIMKYKPIWWNVYHFNRANLRHLTPAYHLANNPWFIFSRSASEKCILYAKINTNIYHLICRGSVANESIFAIMLSSQNELKNVINEEVCATDWSKMETSTSPYTFRYGNQPELDFINRQRKDKYIIFLRKVAPEFPDDILEQYICQKKKNQTYKYDLLFFLWFLYIIFNISIVYHN